MQLSILRNYQQTPNKIIKNQGENKNRNNIFDSHEFIYYISDLIGPLSIFPILFIYIYIYIHIYIFIYTHTHIYR